MDALTDRIDRDIELLKRRYDGDNDLIPGAPVVTYADMELLMITKSLLMVLKYQQAQIDALKDLLK